MTHAGKFEPAARSFKGADVNAVLRLVKQLAPDDGDAQLSILTTALVVGCMGCDVPKLVALVIIEQLFDELADHELVPFGAETLDG